MDLPRLYRMIHDFGGLQNIVDKKQWVKVADAMKIPKTVIVQFFCLDHPATQSCDTGVLLDLTSFAAWPYR